MSGTQPRSEVRILVESSLCIALYLILSAFKLFQMPQGGSITLGMVPLFIFAYRWGAKWGIIAGSVSGILHFLLIGGFFVHPLQIFLDVPLASGMIGLAGLFKNHKIIGILIAGGLRFSCHVLSGVIFFAEYAPIGQNIWIYSAIYNATYLLPSLIVCGIVSLILLKKLPQN